MDLAADPLISLKTAPPKIALEEIRSVLTQQYSLDGELKPLGGECDQNLLLENEASRYLVKIANASVPDGLLDLQTRALRHIANGYRVPPVQKLIAATDGRSWVSGKDQCEGKYRLRVFDYLDGVAFFETPEDPRLMRNLGRSLARLDLSLRGFFHSSAKYIFAWDVQGVDQISGLAAYVDDDRSRVAIEHFLEHFTARIKPVLPRCRAQIIHNDVSFHNVLTDPENSVRIAGIFDFGDMIFAPLIQELGITAAEVPGRCTDPLSRCAEIVSGYHSIVPLEDLEFELLPAMMTARLVQNLLISHWSRKELPWSDRRSHLDGWDEKALAMFRLMQSTDPRELVSRLKAACGCPEGGIQEVGLPESTRSLLARREKYLGNGRYIAYKKPLNLVRGEGVWLHDHNGMAYLDAYNNVPHVGHCHPRVVAAVAKQTAALNVNTRYLYGTLTDYAEQIAQTLPPGLDTCYFVSSGSEANDLAWRLAKNWTGNDGGLVLSNAYHGITDAVYDLSPAEKYNPDDIKSHIAELDAPDDFRGPWKRDNPERGILYARSCEAAITRLAARGHRPAAFFMDMIMSSNGIMLPPAGYLEEVYRLVRAAGGLCVADEVQSGFGRLGKSMWGFELADITPDIVTFGKSIAGGYPMGLVVTRREISEKLEKTCQFFSTTGGNPVACAAASAVLNIVVDDNLVQHAGQMGRMLMRGIRDLAEQSPIIGDVRGGGLFIGVDIIKDPVTLEPDPAQASDLVNALRDRGVLVGLDGVKHNVLKVRPPMVFRAQHVQLFLDRLQSALH